MQEAGFVRKQMNFLYLGPNLDLAIKNTKYKSYFNIYEFQKLHYSVSRGVIHVLKSISSVRYSDYAPELHVGPTCKVARFSLVVASVMYVILFLNSF